MPRNPNDSLNNIFGHEAGPPLREGVNQTLAAIRELLALPENELHQRTLPQNSTRSREEQWRDAYDSTDILNSYTPRISVFSSSSHAPWTPAFSDGNGFQAAVDESFAAYQNQQNTGVSTVPVSANEETLNALNVKVEDRPKHMLCALTEVFMTDPVYFQPTLGTYEDPVRCEKVKILHWLHENCTNPFKRTFATAANLVADVNLKAEIDAFMEPYKAAAEATKTTAASPK